MNLYANEKKKKRPISGSAVTRIIIWSVVFVILCGVFAVGMLLSVIGKGGFSFGDGRYPDADSYQIGGATVSEPITDLDIHWLSGNIEILPAEDGVTDITIEEDYSGTEDADRLRWRVRGGRLQIQFRKSSWRFGKTSLPPKKLTVRLPKSTMDALREVNIDTTDSDVAITGRAAELDLDAVDGKLTVNGHVGELNVDGVNIELDFTGTVGSAELDGVSLTAVFRLDSARELDLAGVAQNVTLCLADTITGFRIDHESAGGSVRIDGFDGVTSKGQNEHYWGDGSFTIDAEGVDSKLIVEKLTKN